MNENMDTSYEDFFGAFEGEDGNQTEAPEETGESETTEEPAEEAAEEDGAEAVDEPESGETAEEESNQEADKDGAEGKDGAEKPNTEQKFVVKVNKETREVSYQDAPAWIQKGMDYDRVKGQLETEQQNSQALQAKLDEQNSIMEVLELAAENSELTIPQLLENVHLSLLMGKGMSEKEAQAEIRAAKAEKQVKTLTEQKAPAKEEPAADDKADRAQREIEEFTKTFPDVALTEELVSKLVPDVQKGMSLTSAYLKMENQRLTAEAEQRKQQEAAAAKNKGNRAKTPGSQRDSGGQRTRTAEDDFFAAFEK